MSERNHSGIYGVEEGEDIIMMNREQTIKKVMEQYEKYGIIKERVEKLYDSGIQAGVAAEIIYPGIKLMLNCEFGLDNTGIAKEIGEGFGEYYIRETKKANEPTTDKALVNRFKEDIEEFLELNILPLTSEMKTAIVSTLEKFIEENQ